MARPSLVFSNVSFTYPESPSALMEDLTFHISAGWTGVSGPNGCGKSTLLKLSTGLLLPDGGTIDRPYRALYCAQRTPSSPESCGPFFQSQDATASYLKGILAIDPDWESRRNTLSAGEKKRCQVGAAIWQEPDLLAIDEPTNHLDATSRHFVQMALTQYSGIGLLVCHDRSVMEALSDRTLLFGALGPALRPLNISMALREEERELAHLKNRKALIEKEAARLKKEARRRSAQVAKSSKRTSRARVGRKDHDTKARIGAARLTGKDKSASKKALQMAARVGRLKAEACAITIPKDHKGEVAFQGAPSHQDTLLSLDEGSLSRLPSFTLSWEALHLGPHSKVGITGDNGAGKSTLLSHILPELSLPPSKVLYIPQEFDEEEREELLEALTALAPSVRGEVMTIITRLGSDPKQVLQTVNPSPGECKKLALALGMVRSPALLIMDEPTNHMDLHSILGLEEALRQFQGALILVSHDATFLNNLTKERWNISLQRSSTQQIALVQRSVAS